MGRINKANWKKTIYYLKRNGFRETWYAVAERLKERKMPPYVWVPPSETELGAQRIQWREKGFTAAFSILVPVYRTKPEYLRELTDSLRRQTYPNWELILADATEDDSVERILRDVSTFGEVDFGDGVQNMLYSQSSVMDAACSEAYGSGEMKGQSTEEMVGASWNRGREAVAHGKDDLEKIGQQAGRNRTLGKEPGQDFPVSEAASPAFRPGRIRYIPLAENAGIAENTNQALPYAAGDYVGLLDHDDILTENALYEMAAAVEEGIRRGVRPWMLYSDEDKCSGDRSEYYEPHFKEDFNLDLLLSNNYICHFLIMKRELIQRLKFRKEFDGSQDYDLVLRAVYALREQESTIVHVPKVLYHWRCHPGSTAENPQSKLYAYESGKRAVQEFVRTMGWQAEAVETAHVGFYCLRYEGGIFACRPDVGAVGGRVVRRGRTVGGRFACFGEPFCGMATEEGRNDGMCPDKFSAVEGSLTGQENAGVGTERRQWDGGSRREGVVLYENLPVSYSGYLHRAKLPQDACAVDIRNIRVRPECRELFRQVVGVPYKTVGGKDMFDASLLPEDCDICRVSLELGRALRKAGYRILYLPHRDSDVKIRSGVVCF